MKALPTDWVETYEKNGVKYIIDLDFNVWNLATEEKIYEETHTGAVDLCDVIEENAKWDDSGDPFTLDDFFSEILLI